ncbi:MAG: hypothetical protein IPN76_06585 [Saprospiraceae bacterium]|nr:hypothetical protein [Saprospiraceae bacterium]
MKKQFFLLLFLLLTFSNACKKDVLEPIQASDNEFYGGGRQVEISEAMAFFQSQRQSLYLDAGGVSTRSVEDDVLTPFHFNPTWMGARPILFANSLEMLAVPVQDSLSNEYMPGSITNMLFYRDSLEGLHVRLFVMVPEPNYASSVNGNYSTQDFTGFSFQLDEAGTLGVFTRIENGTKTHCIQVSEKAPVPFTETIDGREWPPKWWPWIVCPNPNGRSQFFKKIFDFFGDLFGNLFGSVTNPGGAYEQDGEDGIVLTLSDWPPPGNTNNQGGGGGSIFSQDFQNDIFFENTFHYQMSECMGMFSESDPPLIHQLSGHITDWDDQFLLAVNYDLEQILNGGVANFAEALLIEYDDDPTINIFHHLPHYNPPPQVTEALSKVYEKMIMKYKACDNQYDMGGAGAELFDPEFCECVGDYSVKEGLRDFYKNLFGTDDEGVDFLMENKDVLKSALECASDANSMKPVLQTLVYPQNESDVTAMLNFIKSIRNACANRCTDYGFFEAFLTNWLYEVESNPNDVTVSEIREMSRWANRLRENIIGNHLLSFGYNVLDILEVAMFSNFGGGLATPKRILNAVPSSARTPAMNQVIQNIAAPISSFSAWTHAQKFGIKTYNELAALFKQLGLSRSTLGVEFHHLIEQRFANIPGVNQWLGTGTGSWKSVVLTKAEHDIITARWRNFINYDGLPPGSLGVNTSTAMINHVKDAAREIYKDFPEILLALGL